MTKAEYMKEWRKAHRNHIRKYLQAWRSENRRQNSLMNLNWREANREKYLAHHAVNIAVSRGKIEKPTKCERCGAAGTIHGHHPDYKDRLRVEWLCRSCHNEEHRRLAAQAAQHTHPKRADDFQGEAGASNASASALCTREDQMSVVNRTALAGRGE